MLIKPHPAGIPFIAGGAIATLVLFFFFENLGLAGLALTVFCIYFFRDPERVTPQKPSLIISPADGIVSAIVERVSLPAEIADNDERPYTRISIFLSVVDVHVNRVPLSGKITRKVYRPGKFLNADLDKASEENERCSAVIETAGGLKLGLVQIAGLVARRIVNELHEGQSVTAGARFGIIRFGSRLDVYMPEGIPALVCVGQRAIGGETILAEIGSAEPSRLGAVL